MEGGLILACGPSALQPNTCLSGGFPCPDLQQTTIREAEDQMRCQKTKEKLRSGRPSTQSTQFKKATAESIKLVEQDKKTTMPIWMSLEHCQ